MGRKIYMIFSKPFILKKFYSTKAMGGSPGELSEELDVREAKEGLEN